MELKEKTSLELLFEKNGNNKDIVALQLSNLSPMELFVMTRENPMDIDLATKKNLWALVAFQKFGNDNLEEMKTFLTTKDLLFEHSSELVNFFGKGTTNYFTLILAEDIAKKCMPYNSEGQTKRAFGFVYVNVQTLSFQLICETAIDEVPYRTCRFVCFPEDDDYFTNKVVDTLHMWLKTSWFFIFGVSCQDKIYSSRDERNEISCDLRKDTSFKPLFKIIYALLQVPGVFYRDTSTAARLLLKEKLK